MQNTDNYGMRLPIRGVDRANVDDLNYNTNIIDGAMFDNRNISLKMYNDNGIAVYNTGDIVGQVNLSGHISAYVCLDDNVSGTWDATKWTLTDLAEQIEEAKQSGGATELDELDDVEITSPTVGQVVTYDGTDWVNADPQGGDVTKTATGNPIELTDGADAPMVKCVTEIVGSQDLHGYDKPWVGGAGKNKLPLVLADIKSVNTSGIWSGNAYTLNDVTFTVETDGDGNVTQIKVNGTASTTIIFSLCASFSLSAGDYILSNDFANNKAYIELSGKGATASSRQASFTWAGTETNRPYLAVISGYTTSNLIFKPMVRLSTISDDSYSPYSNICPITAYTEGEIEVSDGDGNTITHTTTYPSAIYRGSEDCVNGTATTEWGMIDSYAGETLPGQWISDRDEYVPGTTPTTGAQVAYELATPTTSSVTPTNLPIKSLSGYTHIESSTGEMEIEYFPAKEQPLIDLIPEASNMHEYSTAEHAVGTWIDGSTVYEKTYTYSGNVSANPFETTIDFTGKQFIELIPHYAKYTYDGGSGYGEVVGSELLNNSSEMLQVQYYPEPPTLRVHSFLGNATESYDIAFTLRYTKTASNNRSLAKSAPQEETKEEQVEELKEEPTEEIKEEPTEEVKEEPEELKEEPEEKVEEEKEENENQSESTAR